ncbi:unnamed protein product, partial [Fusarium langsethiae]
RVTKRSSKKPKKSAIPQKSLEILVGSDDESLRDTTADREALEKLEAEEEEAGDRVLILHNQLAELQASLAEAVSRLQRIRKIKKKVKERGADLFERGVQELDKEDNVIPALQSHEDWVVSDLQSLVVPNDVDWASLGLGDGFNDVGPLRDSAVGGSSSGVVGH